MSISYLELPLMAFYFFMGVFLPLALIARRLNDAGLPRFYCFMAYIPLFGLSIWIMCLFKSRDEGDYQALKNKRRVFTDYSRQIYQHRYIWWNGKGALTGVLSSDLQRSVCVCQRIQWKIRCRQKKRTGTNLLLFQSERFGKKNTGSSKKGKVWGQSLYHGSGSRDGTWSFCAAYHR